MDDTFTIEREHDTVHGGRYFISLPDGSEAELTYRLIDPTTMLAEHTGVPPQYRGHGLAQKLVEAAVADARSEGFRIVPQCSYVEAQFRRHPQWSDLRA